MKAEDKEKVQLVKYLDVLSITNVRQTEKRGNEYFYFDNNRVSGVHAGKEEE